MMEGNLGVMSDIKQCLLEDILTDEKTVKLLTDSKDVVLPALDLRYSQVVPWKKVPDTIEEQRTFISFDIRIPQAISKATRIYELNIYVMAHERKMKIDNYEGARLGIDDRGSRIDILADRVDYLINGSKRYTFDEMKFVQSYPFLAATKFFGRQLTYRIRGWNMSGEKIE